MIKLTQKCFPLDNDGWRIDLEYYCDKDTTANEERLFFEELQRISERNAQANRLTKSGNNGKIEIEERKKTNWVKGSKGRFAGSVSDGCGGYTKITKSERKRVSSAICTNFPLLTPGKHQMFDYGNYMYGFTVIEPGTYDFDLKVKIDGNEALLKRLRGGKNDR